MAPALVACHSLPTDFEEGVDYVYLEVHTLGGEKVFSESLPLSASVGDLGAKLNDQRGAARRKFVGDDIVLMDVKATLGEVLSPGHASLTLVEENYPRISYMELVGAHTSNPAYFQQDVFLECLRLVQVCWFEVGGTFKNVPAGSYRVVVEAARDERLRLGGKPFDVSVRGKFEEGFWEFLAASRWDAEPVLEDEFQEFEVARVELNAAGDVHVLLDLREGNWVRGFLWRSMSLHLL